MIRSWPVRCIGVSLFRCSRASAGVPGAVTAGTGLAILPRAALLSSPAAKISECAGSDRLFLRKRLVAAAQRLPFSSRGASMGGKRPKFTFIGRLEAARAGVNRLDMPAGDVVDQRTDGRGGRRQVGGVALALSRGHAPAIRHTAALST